MIWSELASQGVEELSSAWFGPARETWKQDTGDPHKGEMVLGQPSHHGKEARALLKARYEEVGS